MTITTTPVSALALLLAAVGCGSLAEEPADAAIDGMTADAAMDVDAEAPRANHVFATSTLHAGDLGGLSGADAVCNTRAAAAGLSGEYVAYLSIAGTHALDRLGTARGWQRRDGRPFAIDRDGLAAGRVLYPVALDEHGGDAPGEVWTATAGGRHDASGACDRWTSRDAADRAGAGDTRGGPVSFSASGTGACDVPRRLLCLGVDRQHDLPPPSASGRLAFVTRGSIAGTAGLPAFDALCRQEATTAALAGEFWALVSTGVLAPADRFTLTGAAWVRPDGVALVDAAADLDGADALVAPIAVTADGLEYVDATAWTGGAGFGAVNPNCASWSGSGSGIVGRSSLSGPGGATQTGVACATSQRVYCLRI